jgi:hypothetical protein
MLQNPSQIANGLAALRLPPNKALLGIHPALCQLLGVYTARGVADILVRMPVDVGAHICDTVSASVAIKGYPHASTVWQFNDPSVELFVLRQAFSGAASEETRLSALNDILMHIDMHALTYPYIDLDFVENALEFTCEEGQSPSRDIYMVSELDTESEGAHAAARSNPSAPPSAFWIPTLAAGSLLIASIVAKDR